MKSRVRKLVASKGVKVDKKLDNDLKHIMQNNLSEIAEKHPPNTFERIFWEQHAKSHMCKSKKSMRWHPAMIRWCLYLRHLSSKAYEVMRSSGVLHLPSQRTLRDYTHYVPATIGYSSEVDRCLWTLSR